MFEKCDLLKSQVAPGWLTGAGGKGTNLLLIGFQIGFAWVSVWSSTIVGLGFFEKRDSAISEEVEARTAAHRRRRRRAAQPSLSLSLFFSFFFKVD